MIKLTAKDVLFINHTMAKNKNLPQGVAEVSKLKAALLRPHSTFKGSELYPDVYQKAAALADFIIKGRPFKSLNTATALAAGLLLLKKNGMEVSVGHREIADFEQTCQSSTLNVDNLAHWFRSLTRR